MPQCDLLRNHKLSVGHKDDESGSLMLSQAVRWILMKSGKEENFYLHEEEVQSKTWHRSFYLEHTSGAEWTEYYSKAE